MVDGIVSEPGENANEFVFITPDDTEIKTGEFVYYSEIVEVEKDNVGIEDEEKKIFARVVDRNQNRGFPDEFMSNPEVSPKSVARKIGISTEELDLYRITASIIGYYDGSLEGFTNPRIVPQPGTEINLALDEDLEKNLTNTSSDQGKAFIGEVLQRYPDGVEIDIPIDSFAATHLSILASTGSGKSYTGAVLIEEVMKPDSRGAVLILDPHSEYHSLKEMTDMDVFIDEDGYKPKVKIKKPEDLKIRISELDFRDLVSLLDDPSNAQENVLKDAWSNLKNNDQYITLNELKSECQNVSDNKKVIEALQWRLDEVLGRTMFDSSENIELTDILQPGQCSILQMGSMGITDQQLLASVLLRKINKERTKFERNKVGDLGFPVFILLEEGHRFAPAEGYSRSSGILGTILSEGRKFGIGIGIISQRPSKIDDDILSQCKTQIIMQIKNPLDQKAVEKGVEEVGEDLLSELPGLTPGQSIIAGDSVNTPFLARIRERHTTHKAESLEATQEWIKTWKKRQENKTKDIGKPQQDDGLEDREEPL